MPLLAELNNEE
jgi:hypothetical protein